MRRRTFLAVMGAGTLTGCNALGGNEFEHAKQGDAFSNVKNATGLGKGEVGKSAHISLPEGEYVELGFSAKEESEMAMTGQVVKNGPIDLYVMTVDQFNKFKTQPNLISAEMEAENTGSIDLTKTLPAGDYLLVFDNTHLGGTEPSGKAEVEFEFVLTGTGSEETTTTDS